MNVLGWHKDRRRGVDVVMRDEPSENDRDPKTRRDPLDDVDILKGMIDERDDLLWKTKDENSEF